MKEAITTAKLRGDTSTRHAATTGEKAMTRITTTGRLSVFGMSAAAIAVSGLFSGKADAATEEIVVTARKRAETLLEIPESVTAFSADAIERGGIAKLDDVGLAVPNLNLSIRTDGFPNASIRGLGSFGNTQGVGFYVDDVQVFSDASSRFGDLERIEVLKGPQGTLYGGSNIGGAVKFITVRPDDEAFTGGAKLSTGGQGIVDVEGSFNIPLGDSGWATRLFAFSAANDGYLYNPNSPRANGGVNTNESDIGRLDERGVRASLAGAVTDKLNAYASLRWNELDAPQDPWSVELDTDFEFPSGIDLSTNPRHDRETFAGSLELVYDAGALSVTSVTSYTDTETDRFTDLDVSQEFILDLFRPQDLEVFTQELRLTSAETGPIEWLGGLYYANFKDDLDSVLLFRGGASLFDGIIPTAEEEATTIDTVAFENRTRERNQLAAFVTGSYRRGDLEFGGGLRIDRWEVKSTNRDSGISGKQDDTEFLPRASVTWYYDGTDNNVYATISRGFEPGGFNLTNFAGETELFGFEPEDAFNYEVGFKGRFLDGRVTFTAAAFYIDYDERQFELQAVDPVTEEFVEGIVNAGDSKQYGIEADLLWQATDSLGLQLAAGWVDAEWDSGTTLADDTDLSGLTPPYVNELSASVAANYEKELKAGLSLFGRAQLQYKDSFYADLANQVENPDYTVVGLRAGIGTERWEVSASVENLFDEDYYTDLTVFPNFNPLIGQETINIGTLGQPRLFTAAVRVWF